MGMDDWVRVRLGRVGGRLVATPLPRGAGVLTSLVRADGLLVVPAELEGHHAGEEVRGPAPARRGRDRAHDRGHRLARPTARPGSVQSCARRTRLVTLASSNVGSLGGLTALRDGLCHVAGSHLLDPDTGEYTLPYLDRLMPGRDVAVIRLVHREQGLIVAPSNPQNVTGIEDVAVRGLRYVNRQRGAGTRVLLDHELAKRGVSPEAVQGYDREEHTHLAVAAAVAAGRADCGLGVLAAARAFGLGFVPVAQEPYDLVLDIETVEDPLSRPSGRCSSRTTSAEPSPGSAATTPPRWGAASVDDEPPQRGSGHAGTVVRGRLRKPAPSPRGARLSARGRTPLPSPD